MADSARERNQEALMVLRSQEAELSTRLQTLSPSSSEYELANSQLSQVVSQRVATEAVLAHGASSSSGGDGHSGSASSLAPCSKGHNTAIGGLTKNNRDDSLAEEHKPQHRKHASVAYSAANYHAKPSAKQGSNPGLRPSASSVFVAPSSGNASSSSSAAVESEIKMDPPKQPYRTLFFSKHRTIVRVEPRYLPIEVVGAGAYGMVCSANDLGNGAAMCAIKKIESIYETRANTKRTIREIVILRHLRGHENIMELQRVMRPVNEKARDIYVVSDLMETDLGSVIRSNQPLSDDHVQFFVYQILRGLKYIHSANIVHRDLKPRNLLVNSNCDLKICDFGLARVHDYFGRSCMSDYVATRWYRAPEIIQGKGRYGKPVDIWATGCILGELLARAPLLPGRDEVHELQLIKHLLGTTDLKRSTPKRTLKRLKKKLPQANPLALDLLAQMLNADPTTRIDVYQALKHPYLAELHEEDDEPTCPEIDLGLFSWERAGTSTRQLRAVLMAEILDNNPPDNNTYPTNDNPGGQRLAPNPAAGASAPSHNRRHSF